LNLPYLLDHNFDGIKCFMSMLRNIMPK